MVVPPVRCIPQTQRMVIGNRGRNSTRVTCDSFRNSTKVCWPSSSATRVGVALWLRFHPSFEFWIHTYKLDSAELVYLDTLYSFECLDFPVEPIESLGVL